MSHATRISVIAKTLNVESNINGAINSALATIAPFGGEVIISDCGSSDRTVKRALRFPVMLIQIDNPKERCCSIALQLG